MTRYEKILWVLTGILGTAVIFRLAQVWEATLEAM